MQAKQSVVDKQKRMQHAIDLVESGMPLKEVSEITGYAVSTLRRYKRNFEQGPSKWAALDERKFHKEWTDTVNKFRKASGLPLFK
jgi:hypothetical protein